MKNWVGLLIVTFAYSISCFTQQDLKAINEGEKYASKAEEYSIKGVKACENDNRKKCLELFEKSIAFYTQAIDADPQEDNYYLNRGLTYDYIENETAALEDFTKGIELNPDKTLCYIARSQTRRLMDDYQGSYADAMKHSEIYGDDNESLQCKRHALLNLKEFEVAITVITQIIEKNPDNDYYYINRAVCYIETANFDAA